MEILYLFIGSLSDRGRARSVEREKPSKLFKYILAGFRCLFLSALCLIITFMYYFSSLDFGHYIRQLRQRRTVATTVERRT